MLTAQIIQRPVGQGGLCEGWVANGDQPKIRWLFDCGSNQLDLLRREMGKVSARIDLLFLSHLHSDHVVGLDHFLPQARVEEVVLPYLTATTRVLLLGQAFSQGAVAGQFLEFMADPPAWLFARGVQRVTYVGGDDGGEAGSSTEPVEPGGDVEGQLKPKWSGDRSAQPSTSIAPTGDVAVVAPGSQILLAASGGLANWVFLPHVQTPSAARQAAFDTLLATSFPGLSSQQIATSIWSKANRAKLRACYDKLWKDHNLVSLSLYAGPLIEPPFFRTELQLGHGFWSQQAWSRSGSSASSSWGWISTGDADLSGVRRRDAFKRTYARYIPHVSVLLAPHHGSRHNWHDDILTGMTGLRIGLAAAGPNSYGHPHREVRDGFSAHGVRLRKIGKKRCLLQRTQIP